MTDHAHELRRHARKIAHPAGDVPAVMLAAADEIERLRTENAGLVDDMNLLRDNNTALRARIEAMEKQEPVAWIGQQYTLLFVGSGSMTELVKRHGISSCKIGSMSLWQKVN